MRKIFVLGLLAGVGACSKPVLSENQAPAAATVEVELQDLGPAPELTNEIWLNSDRPLTLEALQGKVVLL